MKRPSLLPTSAVNLVPTTQESSPDKLALRRFTRNPIAMLGGLLLKPALGALRRDLHPDTTGGAILLGLRGIAVVGHGSSGAEGVANAVRLAARCAEVDAVGRTAALLREGGAGRGALAGGGAA